MKKGKLKKLFEFFKTILRLIFHDPIVEWASSFRKTLNSLLRNTVFRWIICSIAYVTLVTLLSLIYNKLFLGSWGLPDLSEYRFSTPALYFFSAVAQTMGALLAITFTVFYISIQNLHRINFNREPTNDEETKTFLEKVIALEPLKRIMINDDSLKKAYISGIVTILASIAGILIIFISASNESVCFYILVILSPVVAVCIVESIFSTLHFVKERFGFYSDPSEYLLGKIFDLNNNKLRIEKNHFVDELLLLFYSGIDKDRIGKDNMIISLFKHLKKEELDDNLISSITNAVLRDTKKWISSNATFTYVNNTLASNILGIANKIDGGYTNYSAYRFLSRIIANIAINNSGVYGNVREKPFSTITEYFEEQLKDTRKYITQKSPKEFVVSPFPLLFDIMLLRNIGIQVNIAENIYIQHFVLLLARWNTDKNKLIDFEIMDDIDKGVRLL